MSQRLYFGPRTNVFRTAPSRPGNGSSRRWARTIGGNRFSFTVVNMPNGELRMFVKVYNGYGDMGTPESRESGMRFDCAWTRVHDIIIKPN